MYSLTIMWIDDGFIASGSITSGAYNGQVFSSEQGIRYPNPHEAAISVLDNMCSTNHCDVVPESIANASEHTRRMYVSEGMGI